MIFKVSIHKVILTEQVIIIILEVQLLEVMVSAVGVQMRQHQVVIPMEIMDGDIQVLLLILTLHIHFMVYDVIIVWDLHALNIYLVAFKS